jgi:hypothetical protein
MRHFVTITLLLLLAAGCGTGIRVSGTVTYEEDGSPVQQGSVNFSTDKSNFSGVISKGKYVTGGNKNVQGIPAGQYKIWLAGTDNIEVITDKDGTQIDVKFHPTVSREFTSASTTPLSFTVGQGGAMYNIVVKKPEK